MNTLRKGRAWCALWLVACWLGAVGCVSQQKQLRDLDDDDADWEVPMVAASQAVRPRRIARVRQKAKLYRWELELFRK